MFRPGVPMEERTVGVVERDDSKIFGGLTLLCAGLETYLIDSDGRVVHEWRSERPVFAAYLLPNGNLLRDGSENDIAVAFQAVCARARVAVCVRARVAVCVCARARARACDGVCACVCARVCNVAGGCGRLGGGGHLGQRGRLVLRPLAV